MRFTEKERVYLESKLNVDRDMFYIVDREKSKSILSGAFYATNYDRLIGQMKMYNSRRDPEPISHGQSKE